MEAQHVLEELGEPVVSYISAHEVIEVENKKVSWYTIETTWSKDRMRTTKKQRFKYIQEALLRVRDTKERLKIAVQLPMLPLSIIRGTSEVIRAQRTSEFNAFLAAVLSVPKLRVLPSLVLLLAPDDTGSQSSMPVGDGSTYTSAVHSRASSAVAATSSSTMHAGDARRRPEGNVPSWLPAEPSTRSMTTAGAGAASHDDLMHGAHAHDEHSESEDGGATSHTGGHATQQMHGFRLQPPMQRYPYHGMETNLVASSSKVARLETMIARCLTVSKRLQEELETKDATIRHLQEELARSQEALHRAQGPSST